MSREDFEVWALLCSNITALVWDALAISSVLPKYTTDWPLMCVIVREEDGCEFCAEAISETSKCFKALSNANESLYNKITVWLNRTRLSDDSRQHHTAPLHYIHLPFTKIHTQLQLDTFYLHAYTLSPVTLPLSFHSSFHSLHTLGLYGHHTHLLTCFRTLFGHHTLPDSFWGSFWPPHSFSLFLRPF